MMLHTKDERRHKSDESKIFHRTKLYGRDAILSILYFILRFFSLCMKRLTVARQESAPDDF